MTNLSTMAFKNWAKIDFQKNSSYTSDFKFSFSLSHGPLTSYVFFGTHTCMCAARMSVFIPLCFHGSSGSQFS